MKLVNKVLMLLLVFCMMSTMLMAQSMVPRDEVTVASGTFTRGAGTGGGVTALAANFRIPITITDGITTVDRTFGVDPAGTDAFDSGLDSLAAPAPPGGNFDARFAFDNTEYVIDVRSDVIEEKFLHLATNQLLPAAPAVLTWDTTGLSQLGTFVMTDDITGTVFSLDMTTTNTLDTGSDPFIANALRILVTPFDQPEDPDISIDPTSNDYGDVTVGLSASQTFTVSNDGSGDLEITSTTITGTDAADFSIDSGGGAVTLAAGASQDIVVSFSPSSAGAKTGSLTINSNDPDENPLEAALDGNGVAATGTVTSAIDPSNTTVDAGASFTIDVSIDMADAPVPDTLLGSFTATLSWDPAVIDYSSNGGVLAGFTGVVNVDDAANGNITFNGAKHGWC